MNREDMKPPGPVPGTARGDAGRRSAAASGSAPEQDNFFTKAPTLSLPKGGGAIRGMGEQFQVNPATGTGGFSVPLPLSPGRGGFGPQLTLSYDSGGGNGPFGFGWNVGLASITRKTDKGLPQYRDADESDVFLMSGAEDRGLCENRQPRCVG